MAIIYLCGDEASPDENGKSMLVRRVKDRLKSMNCTVIVPREEKLLHVKWSYMLDQRKELLNSCHAIFVLPSWKDHIISRIELTLAMEENMLTLYSGMNNKDLRELIATLDS